MRPTKLCLKTALLIPIVFVPSCLWAQTSNGTLVGTVVDQSEGALRAATVSAISSEHGVARETHTDFNGTYRLESLQPGNYRVTIVSPGFRTVSVDGVVINGSLTTTINGKLALAAEEQTIEVHADAAQIIDTQSGQLGGNISAQEINQMPYFSLNSAELALTLPGVHDTPQGQGAVNTYFTQGVAFSVNGTRPRANNFLIDGQDDNDYNIGGQSYQPTNIGAIQEVSILTNAYSAEYGRGGGSVVNYIYASGTNDFHGGLWEINRNSAFAAVPAQDEIANTVSKNPYDNENIFGFDLGGPLKKDKLFFFGTAQWDLEHQLVTGPVFKLPTSAGIAALKSLEPNANIALLLSAIGSLESPGQSGVIDIPLGLDPNSNPRPNVEAGNFQMQNVKTIFSGTNWNARIDWQFTNRDTLTGSAIRDTLSLSPDNAQNPAALPNFQTRQGGTSEIVRGQWTHTISSALLNEARLSNTNIDYSFPLTTATLAGPQANLPFIQFGTDIDFPSIGVDSNFPQGRAHNIWQIQEALSYARGRHTIKGGADVTVLSLHDVLPLNTRGTIQYSFGGTDSTGATYSSLGNFIDDFTGALPGTISKSFGNPNLNSSATMLAPYIQDTWRIKDNLTIDLGLRYEYWGALANALAFPAIDIGIGPGAPAASYSGLYGNRQVPDKRNFAPRVGVAYAPRWGRFPFGDGKTVFRAGYGIFYDGLFSNIVDNTAESQPNTGGGSIPAQANRGMANASTLGVASITSAPNPLLAAETMASNLHNPLTQQWNANVQMELGFRFVLTLAYVGTRGEHLFANQDFNPAVGLDQFGNYTYTNPNFSEIAVRTNAGDSIYNSAQVELERKVSRNLILRAAYTYSKFYDDTSEIQTTTGSSSYPQVLNDQHSDWGPSAFDQRNRLTIAYVWQTPYLRRNAFLKTLTDRWQWSGIATIESGTPNTVEVGFDNIGNGHPNSRPDLANPSAPLNSFGIDGGDAGLPPGTYDFNCVLSGSSTCVPEPYNTFHFVVPNSVPGNVGRNSLFGPGQVYFDTSIQRDFAVHFWNLENQIIEFRMEMFNVLNHPNRFTPTYTMTDPNFDNTAATINGARQIKFWLKYSF